MQSTVVERVNPILTTQEIKVGSRALEMMGPVASQEIVIEEVAGAARRGTTQPLITGTVTSSAGQAGGSMAAAGIDTTGDGRANLVFVGADRNRDGIPDALEQQVPLG